MTVIAIVAAALLVLLKQQVDAFLREVRAEAAL